jgi:PAS domain-containing protein
MDQVEGARFLPGAPESSMWSVVVHSYQLDSAGELILLRCVDMVVGRFNANSAQGTAMDQVVNEPSLSDEQLQQIISALQIGFIFVDPGGCILWIDERTRQLLNGDLQHVELPISHNSCSSR